MRRPALCVTVGDGTGAASGATPVDANALSSLSKRRTWWVAGDVAPDLAGEHPSDVNPLQRRCDDGADAGMLKAPSDDVDGDDASWSAQSLAIRWVVHL